MNKTKQKEIAKLILKDIEKELRVEEKPVPPSQLRRIERMLKWLTRSQEKPIVTKESINEKAVEIYNLSYYKSFSVEEIADCIRSFVGEG